MEQLCWECLLCRRGGCLCTVAGQCAFAYPSEQSAVASGHCITSWPPREGIPQYL